ncbi:ribonuclease H2 subunit A-like [Schistocerca gregaria]|uniref:ribonuclease H2 subunit A-like n=1 Tax=Schistocerca gregaria TaxID=7010 RepID=UPI00211F0451|nr:ribonuclease H2 subunit A-like [Schistocerca gregaria]
MSFADKSAHQWQNWMQLDYQLEKFYDFNNRPVCVGIDEAGRGPVLGPMVYAATFCAVEDKNLVSQYGYQDSKQLTPSKRESLFKTLESGIVRIGYIISVITAEEICGLMTNKVPTNLNEISHQAAMNLLNKIVENGSNVQEVYVDTVGNPEKYASKIRQSFPTISNVVVSKRADALYSIVSSASVCAKVVRDQVLDRWTFSGSEALNKDRDWGSGYPSDPKTKLWMKRNFNPIFGFPNVVRFSWKPCMDMIDQLAVPVKWRDEIESDCTEATSSKCFDRNTVNRNGLGSRFCFFARNDMELACDF